MTLRESGFVSLREARKSRDDELIAFRFVRRVGSSRAAPDFRDLDWVRLMRNTYRTEFVRGWVVALGVWAFTVVWIVSRSSASSFSRTTRLTFRLLLSLRFLSRSSSLSPP